MKRDKEKCAQKSKRALPSEDFISFWACPAAKRRVGLSAVSLLHFVPQHACGVPLLSLTCFSAWKRRNFILEGDNRRSAMRCLTSFASETRRGFHRGKFIQDPAFIKSGVLWYTQRDSKCKAFFPCVPFSGRKPPCLTTAKLCLTLAQNFALTTRKIKYGLYTDIGRTHKWKRMHLKVETYVLASGNVSTMVVETYALVSGNVSTLKSKRFHYRILNI